MYLSSIVVQVHDNAPEESMDYTIARFGLALRVVDRSLSGSVRTTRSNVLEVNYNCFCIIVEEMFSFFNRDILTYHVWNNVGDITS